MRVDDCENIHSVDPLHQVINFATGYLKKKMTNILNSWFYRQIWRSLVWN